MSFIFRSIFWLALAIVVVPPEARLGGHDTADFRNVDIEQELHNAAFTAWSYAANASSACDANPRLCRAAAGLWDTTWTTMAELANYTPPSEKVETREIRLNGAKSVRGAQ